jgi:chromosome segregation ATPase
MDAIKKTPKVFKDRTKTTNESRLETALAAAKERIKELESEIKDRHESEQVALKELATADDALAAANERINVLNDALSLMSNIAKAFMCRMSVCREKVIRR